MNKFQKTIAASNESTLTNRAKLLVSSVENQMSQKIFAVKNKINDVKMQIEQLTDVAPENTFDLRPGGTNFDPEAWVTKIVKLKTELYTLSVELEIAVEIEKEWFKDESDGEN